MPVYPRHTRGSNERTVWEARWSRFYAFTPLFWTIGVLWLLGVLTPVLLPRESPLVTYSVFAGVSLVFFIYMLGLSRVQKRQHGELNVDLDRLDQATRIAWLRQLELLRRELDEEPPPSELN